MNNEVITVKGRGDTGVKYWIDIVTSVIDVISGARASRNFGTIR